MAVSYKDYYKLLGVSRSASEDEISKAYKKLARQYHPDLNPGDKQAEEKFKEITEAYEVLKSPEKRRQYDLLGSNWQHGQQFQGAPGFENMHFNFNGQDFSGAGFSDFFETLFGGAQRSSSRNFGPDPFAGFSSRQRRGRDRTEELPLTLEDVLRGGKKDVTVRLSTGPKVFSVTIPSGIKEGGKLRLTGKGEQVPGGTPGDLYLQVRYLPHKEFRVEGETLFYDLPVTPWEAALGASVSVPTLEGSVELSIPAGASSGKKLRLRGKGLGRPQSRGDLLVCIQIKMPTELSDQERSLWEQLAAVSSFTAR